jgi:uncharacterized Zn finger protein (UPF0148 family)
MAAGLALAAAALAVVTAGLALAPALAEARPGGGHGFSGGGGSFGGGGGGGGGEGDIVFFLIWLCIDHPAVGLPVAAVVGTLWVVKRAKAKRESDWSSSVPATPSHRASAAVSPRRLLERLRAQDANFSLVVFEDFVYALFQRAHHLRGQGELEQLDAYLTDSVRRSLTAHSSGLTTVDGIVIGSLRYVGVGGVDAGPDSRVRVTVLFEANYTERRGDDAQGYYVAEQWQLERRAGAQSRPPDRARTFECPSCGAPLEGVEGGRCQYCGQQVDTGNFDWVVTAVTTLRRESRSPAVAGHVEERGTDLPTVRDPKVETRLEKLRERDPTFELPAFDKRVSLIFHELNQAWSARDFRRARAYVSDALFETQMFWMHAYRQAGLRNVIDRAELTEVEPACVTTDRFFDAITVRIYARSVDYTVRDSDGRVVSGSRRKLRRYSEYWTLIRGTGTTGQTTTEAKCPSCGAPLDVNQGGECAYCSARVTTGEFDWVLSRIEQDEAYAG